MFVDWTFLGGIVARNPSVTLGTDNAVYIAVRDSGGGVYVCRYAEGPGGWFFGGGLTDSDPMIASDGSGTIAVGVLSVYSSPAYVRFSEGAEIGWQAWTNPGGVFSRMSLAAINGTVYIAGVNPWSIYWYRSTDRAFLPVSDSSVVAGEMFATPR